MCFTVNVAVNVAVNVVTLSEDNYRGGPELEAFVLQVYDQLARNRWQQRRPHLAHLRTHI
jgi:hypothetical protein